MSREPGFPKTDNPSDCKHCGWSTVKVIYMGMPGRLCMNEACSCLYGLASYMPPVSDGERFAFMAYHGSYWRALWQWLTAPMEE